MKVALTGDTALAREELVARGVQAGLNVMSNVSRHTRVLVTNDARSGSAKPERAWAEGVPVIDEGAFLELLAVVRPGVPLEQAPAVVLVQRVRSAAPAGARAAVMGPCRAAASSSSATTTPRRRRRVLGVAKFGAAAAVNLSGSVTDV